MKEIFTPIITWKGKIKYDFTGIYEISNYGTVKSVNRIDNNNHPRNSQVIKPRNHKGLYYRVGLRNGQGKQLVFFVHRLVWESFNGKIPDGMVINHLDENGHNNKLSNLSTCSVLANNCYGTRLNRVSKKNYNGKCSKPILQFDLDGNFIKEWVSQSEIERQLGFKQENISNCCKEKYKQAYGYRWEYKKAG